MKRCIIMVDRRQLSLGFAFILLLGTGVLAAQAQLSDGADPPAGKREPASRTTGANVAGSAAQACKFRTHDCETCAVENGTVTCSSVGIACQPAAWRCLDLQVPEK